MKAYLELQHWWDRTDTKIVTAETPDRRIVELERRYDLTLPNDFKQYLRFSSPVGEAWDSEMGTWWDFDRIKNIPDEYPHELEPVIASQSSKYLIFADHCVWCWAWAISCADDENRGKVALIGGRGHDKFVADTFSDFVRKYVTDWAAVC